MTGWGGGGARYVSKVHLGRVDLEDVAPGLLVRRGELYLAVDAARADECGVE